MSALRSIEWESCLLEPARDPELEAYLRRELGMVPGMAHYLTPCPWMVRSLAGINQYHALLVHVDLKLADLIGLVVSQDNSCRFCYAVQRTILRIQGFGERRIRELQEDLLAAELSPRERTALEFARRLSRATPLPSTPDVEPLRAAGWSELGIREIAFVASTHVYYNRVATLPAMPPETMEGLPDRWWMRLASPLLARWMRRSTGAPDSLDPAACSGPYSDLVERLAGLPAARALRRLLDEAFSSPVLAPRAKAVVFAVVARGLGCVDSEAEALRLLVAEGAAPEDVEDLLAHLSSPRFDPTERAVASLARDTIWYEPAQIQRRARELRETLGVSAFVEFVGLAALANAVCRLNATVPH